MAELSEFSFPWDSENGDREYTAEDFMRYYRSFISSGLFMGVSTNLQVVAHEGLVVKVKAGSAIIDGSKYDNEGEILITLTTPDGLLDRIDRIVVQWDKENRETSVKLLTGTPAAEPTAPDITRTTDIKEYALADILVNAGATEILQSKITDQRMNSTICGMAVPFATIDTSALAAQYEAWVQEAMASGDAAALALLEEMRDILDDSAAGHLQNELDDEALRRKGFEGGTIVFNNDGSITSTDEDGKVSTTIFNNDGSIDTTLKDEYNMTIATKHTVFNADGSITNTVTRG
jgi:hypothetical protein